MSQFAWPEQVAALCRALTTDLRTGKVSRGQPDLPAVGDAARELSAAVKEATRKPPKRRGKSRHDH
jgi:hypothetical protein